MSLSSAAAHDAMRTIARPQPTALGERWRISPPPAVTVESAVGRAGSPAHTRRKIFPGENWLENAGARPKSCFGRLPERRDKSLRVCAPDSLFHAAADATAHRPRVDALDARPPMICPRCSGSPGLAGIVHAWRPCPSAPPRVGGCTGMQADAAFSQRMWNMLHECSEKLLRVLRSLKGGMMLFPTPAARIARA